MLDIFKNIVDWTEQQKAFAIATVIKTWRSAPRSAGAAMIIAENMDIAGSVSGGCIEGAVIREALQVLKTKQAKRLHFGVSNEDAWSVGLSCGGKVEVYIEPSWDLLEKPTEQIIWQNLKQALENQEGCVLISYLSRSNSQHELVFPNGNVIGKETDVELLEKAKIAYLHKKSQVIEHQGEAFFFNVFPGIAQLIIIGAAHLSADLVDLAHQFNFETIVIEPRGIFADKMTFNTPPKQLYHEWPAEVLPHLKLNKDSFAVTLTHDPKIDDQALHILLRSDVAYIGALGSRRTQEKRLKRLREAGFLAEEIDRIHGPIGIAINALQPKEIALSIVAELIKVRNAFLGHRSTVDGLRQTVGK